MTPTPDESRFVLNGVAYVAVEVQEFSCKGCDLFDVILTSMCALVLKKQNRASCHDFARQDHRNIVWKREAGK